MLTIIAEREGGREGREAGERRERMRENRFLSLGPDTCGDKARLSQSPTRLASHAQLCAPGTCCLISVCLIRVLGFDGSLQRFEEVVARRAHKDIYPYVYISISVHFCIYIYIHTYLFINIHIYIYDIAYVSTYASSRRGQSTIAYHQRGGGL